MNTKPKRKLELKTSYNTETESFNLGLILDGETLFSRNVSNIHESHRAFSEIITICQTRGVPSKVGIPIVDRAYDRVNSKLAGKLTRDVKPQRPKCYIGESPLDLVRALLGHRKLTSHKVNGCNDEIEISVLDAQGDGGANHLYLIEGVDPSKNKSWKGRKFRSTAILFQNGPIPQNGTNGVTQEALLAILIDRLEGFQGGKFSCLENEIALGHLRSAQGILKQRTRDRVKRQVEGTHKL